MRKIMLGVVAATLTLPAIPAQAGDGYYNGRTWRDSQGRVRCKKKNGTVGLLVGGAAGALAGRAIDSHGSRATGTVLGAAAGALLGRKVDRDNSARRCN